MSVTDNRLAGTKTTTYAYDPASNVATATYPNGSQMQFQYDALNRVSGLASQVSGYSYQRNAVGNLTGALELNGRAVNWNYDGINRLTSESISADPSTENGNLSYGLDPVGNRLTISSSLNGVSSGTYSFNLDDEINSESYDLNGNTTATGGKAFTYNSQNQLVSMNGGALAILYDGDGNRVGKSVNGVPTWYLVDDLNPTGYPQVVEELSGSGVDRQYTYGLQRISEIQILNNAWTPSFYGYDGGGNVRYLENAAGAVTDTYEYDSYGNQTYRSGSTPNNYMYRGEQFDSDLGLYYLRARYYNTMTGRFVSMDPENGIPTDPNTLHKYDYAGGDPVNAIDPSGRAAQSATWGRPGIEYVGLIAAISFGVVKSAPLVAQAASCVLDTAASLLRSATTHLGSPIVSISINSDSCSAKVTKCRPCIPPVGTIAYREDTSPNSPPHRGVPPPHWHLYEMNQNPNNCQCFWSDVPDNWGGFGPSPPPPGAVPITPAAGGGYW
jgi:RHS repeat-associated protein